MKKTRDLKGMPVMSLQEGEHLGHVRDLILDPAAGQVVALLLDRRTSGGEPQVVATANIHNVGEKAITIEDRSRLVPLSRIPRFKELVRTTKPIYGKMVITEKGAELGRIADLELDPQTFRIVSFLLKGVLRSGRGIPADQVRTIGTDAVVVRDEPPVEIRPAPTTLVSKVPPAPAPAAPEELPAPYAPPEPPAPPATPAPPEMASPAPQAAEIAKEAEPAIPPVSTPAGTSTQPAAELLPPPESLPPAEPLPPAEEVPAPTFAEDAVSPSPDEPAPEDAADQAGDNAWQRWVRRLRRHEEEQG